MARQPDRRLCAVASDTNFRSADALLVKYRLYVLNERNRIFGPAQLVNAVNDERAIEAAQLLDERAIELWEDDRLVFRVTPNKSCPISPLGRAFPIGDLGHDQLL
jgi:hypothetical protein